jgi:hypothetical protein
VAGIHFSARTVGVFTTASRIPLGSIEAPMQSVQEVLYEETKVKNCYCSSANRLSNVLRGAQFLQQIDLQLGNKCPTCHANRKLITIVTRAGHFSYCKQDGPSWRLPSYFLKNNVNIIHL